MVCIKLGERVGRRWYSTGYHQKTSWGDRNVTRATLDLTEADDLKLVKGAWRFARGLVPGEENEGLVARIPGSPARLADYDDSSWEVTTNIGKWRSGGLSFIWYRIKVTIPETVKGRDVQGTRCLLETCIDDYGEIWIDGECDRQLGAVQGFNVPQRVVVNADPHPGDSHLIALLAVNGPIAAPVFVRYANLSFEWRDPRY